MHNPRGPGNAAVMKNVLEGKERHVDGFGCYFYYLMCDLVVCSADTDIDIKVASTLSTVPL